MESNWSDDEAQRYVERYAEQGYHSDLALRVYTSRLIGRDARLVLHGGGNTSVKTRMRDDLGEDVEVLCVKGSGWDLGDIEPEGHPAVRLRPLLGLRQLRVLSDEDMVNAQRTRLLDASAPNPSVETLLHAFLPHKYVDHSHADAILALVDQPEAEHLCRELYGQRLGIVPYIMPGFALAKLAAEIYEENPGVEGVLLLQHGLFTFGDTARESYDRHIAAVDAAESFIGRRRYWRSRQSLLPAPKPPTFDLLPVLRGALGDRGRRYVFEHRTSKAIEEFVNHDDLASLAQRGCATPDHVIRTKRFPLLLQSPFEFSAEELQRHIRAQVNAYRESYRAYVKRQSARVTRRVAPLDPDPRVVLVPGIGLIGVGQNAKAARIAADIYEHTIDVILGAEAVGSFQALSEEDIFDMEYWSLEQAKLGKQQPKPLDGRIVYITGAASGIGAATARHFRAAGAELYLVDARESALREVAEPLGARWEVVDLTREAEVEESIQGAVEGFGGLDGVVSNAGTAPQGLMDEVSTSALDDSLRINLFAHQWVAAAAVRVFKRQGTGGFLLFNASKSAFNPGPGFGPYAIAKAALVALMKQYAVEGGAHGVRANAINADRVRTGLMSEGDIAERARARGLDADAYFRANLLQREVTVDDVAQAFLNLALADSTTGCTLTVDGGNIAASPR